MTKNADWAGQTLILTLANEFGLSFERMTQALYDLISTEFLPYLRVAVRSDGPMTGRYVHDVYPGGIERASAPGEEHHAHRINRARLRFEAEHSLIVRGERPVSGLAVLSSPPGLPKGALVSWLNCGMDDSLVYGDTLTVLQERVLERTLFVSGDSFNLLQQGEFDDHQLTAREASCMVATCGVIPKIIGRECEFVEALVLGGLNFDQECEEVPVGGYIQPHRVCAVLEEMTQGEHEDYFSWRLALWLQRSGWMSPGDGGKYEASRQWTLHRCRQVWEQPHVSAV